MEEGDIKLVLNTIIKQFGLKIGVFSEEIAYKTYWDFNTYSLDINYVSLYGTPDQISRKIYSQLDPDRIMFSLKAMEDFYVWVPPELRYPSLRQYKRFVVAEKYDVTDGRRYVMPFAYKYLEIGKKRRKNCVKACIILLRVAPFHQKCLRKSWVRDMILSTWEDEVWE